MTHSSGYNRKTYHSPLSSENRRSLFVELAKRGKQRVGGGLAISHSPPLGRGQGWVSRAGGGPSYIYPNHLNISLRLATIISRMRIVTPVYSARIMNFSLGLRPVMIS